MMMLGGWTGKSQRGNIQSKSDNKRQLWMAGCPWGDEAVIMVERAAELRRRGNYRPKDRLGEGPNIRSMKCSPFKLRKKGGINPVEKDLKQ